MGNLPAARTRTGDEKRLFQPLMFNWTDVVTPSGYPSECPRHPSSLHHTPTPERDGGAARPPHRRRRAPPRPRPPPSPPPPGVIPPVLLSHSPPSRRPRRTAPPTAAAFTPPRPPARCLRRDGRIRHPHRVSLASECLRSIRLSFNTVGTARHFGIAVLQKIRSVGASALQCVSEYQ
jgi:hypothetical protein